jgi:hypothetical protein
MGAGHAWTEIWSSERFTGVADLLQCPMIRIIDTNNKAPLTRMNVSDVTTNYDYKIKHMHLYLEKPVRAAY